MKSFRTRRLSLLLLAMAFALRMSATEGAPNESVSQTAGDGIWEAGSRDGANFARAEFRLWFPTTAKSVRAVLVLTPGSNADGRGMVDEEEWRTFAASHDLALVACYFTDRPHEFGFVEEYAAAARGTGHALLNALVEFAQRSQHPELAEAPLLLWGISAGGEFNYEFAAWKPERVIGFIVNKGGIYYSALLPPAARAVPALLFAGERDLSARTDVIKGLFALNRRAGARWALTVERGAAHEEGQSRALSRLFFDALLDRRLRRPGEPLAPLNESEGVHGDPATGALTPAASAPSSETISAWLPNQRVAEAWQAVVRGG